MMIYVKKLHPLAKWPNRSSENAGGWDVFCVSIEQPEPDLIICKTGIAMRPADSNYKITLVPRSSLTKTGWIMQNSPGLGDPDYTGEYQFRFRALPIVRAYFGKRALKYPKSPFAPGDRIGQIYLEEIIPIEFEEVLDLPKTERGDGGFGSTGKQ
jgi:dUTP pyrophosphatase